MLNRMLRYADAIVKRGVDKLIDVIAHSPEPQTENAETPHLSTNSLQYSEIVPVALSANCALLYLTHNTSHSDISPTV